MKYLPNATRAICLLTILAGVSLAQTPATELHSVLQDLEKVAPAARSGYRYLSLYAVPPGEPRREAAQIVAYTLNALSRSRAISQPQLVTPTLLRFDIGQYTTNATEYKEWQLAWGDLAHTDPYWHIRTEVLVDGKPKVVTVDGGWVDLDDANKLLRWTGSVGAILRADDFVARATRTPSYYDFVGIPATEGEFLKSIGIDLNTIRKLRADAGANLLISKITDKPRRVVWLQGPLGGVYSTLDTEQVDAERDPIRRAITDSGLEFRYDASEWFAMGPNGTWRTALYGADGKVQQSVPDKIAKDDSDPHGDGIVTPLVSCIRCHVEGGLRPFRDDQTRLLTETIGDGPPPELLSYDPRIVQRAAEFFDEPRLQRQMAFDRSTYTATVDIATGGMTPEQVATALGNVVREFAYLPVSPEQAAREIGCPADDIPQLFRKSHDPILLLLAQGREVPRGLWESAFQEAALAAENR